MGTPKDVYQPFVNEGLILKLDPSLLKTGQYSQLTNMESDVEGVLTVRGGTQLCGEPGTPGSHIEFLHTITRLVIPNAPTARYIGIGQYILKTQDLVETFMTFHFQYPPSPITLTSTSNNIKLQRFQDADYGAEGQELIYKFFACPNAMMKDAGTASTVGVGQLQTWGIFPPVYPVQSHNTGVGTGPVAFTGAEVPYTYVYTFLNVLSGAESNPSQIQVPAFGSTTVGVTPNGHQIELQLYGTNDPQISTTQNSIKVYRAGGSFGDGLYRFCGYAINPTLSAYVNFEDTSQDQDIIDNELLETDNDPPVPSGLPITFLIGATVTSGGTAGSLCLVTLGTSPPAQGPAGFWPSYGDTLYIDQGTGYQETVFVEYSSYPNLQFFTQVGRNLTTHGCTVTCTTSTGAPCTLALNAFQSIFLAGDVNNPNFLYQSKPNQPESFPIIQQSTGIIQSISVGTPANPINGIAEYGGAIICLNLQNIFSISLFNNQMQIPVPTPARHGLITPGAWVKVMNAIWYLSYDGIYSFTGGQETWMSEAIDPLFKGLSMNGYLPIDFTPGNGANNPPTGLDVITMTTVDNNVVMNYTDTAGLSWRLVYELNFNRWHIEQFFVGQLYTVTAQYSEPDTGFSWIAASEAASLPQPLLLLTDTGTTDGWETTGTDGSLIGYQFSPTVIDQQAKTDKLFSDIIVESEAATGQQNVIINCQYDWSGTNDPTDAFNIVAKGTRYRTPFALQNSANGPEGKLAYAMQVIFSGLSNNTLNFYTFGLHYEDLTDYKVGLSVDYSDLGYADDKTLRSATVEIDTGSINAIAFLDVDSVLAVQQWTINTNYYNRKVILSINSFTTGKMVRMRFQAGTGGKANLYGMIAWNFEKLPPALTHWDSDTIAPWNGYQFWKQVWMCLVNPAEVTMTIYGDNNELFWTETIPTMTTRDTYRFYLPSVYNDVLNKSLVKRFTLDSTVAFRLYADASRVEWLPCGSDQRQDYEQLVLSEPMQPQ